MLAKRKTTANIIENTAELYTLVGLPKEQADTFDYELSSYQFALGFQKNGNACYDGPGFTEKHSILRYEPELLIEHICTDIRNLGKEYRVININESSTVKLKRNEDLLKIFFAAPDSIVKRGDFYVTRYDKKKQKWFHKPGYEASPRYCDEDDIYAYMWLGVPMYIIKQRNTANSYVCHPIAYIAIRPRTWFSVIKHFLEKL